MKYKVQVIADRSGEWAGNGLTFDTVEAAKDYAKGLMDRWMLVTNWRVVAVQDEEGPGHVFQVAILHEKEW